MTMQPKTSDTKQNTSIKDRIIEAILRHIEGSKDIKKKFDYLMNPETLSSSSILSESQVQAVNECEWLGNNFPSLGPLADFSKGYASWTISRDGKGRDQLTTIMVSENHAEGIGAIGMPMLTMQTQDKDGKGHKKSKEKAKED